MSLAKWQNVTLTLKLSPLIPAKAGIHFLLLQWIPAFAGMSGWRCIAFYVYMLASKKHGTLYTGMTDDLAKRVWMHKEKILKGFTSKYGVDKLVWYEVHETRESAFIRERAIKKWNRAWKIEMIEKENPNWADLYETIMH